MGRTPVNDRRTGGMLEVSGLVKDYPLDDGWHRAVDGIDFEVREGAFFSLLGPSGCGKTTTLRCVAGLERQDAGRISIGGQVVAEGDTYLPPERRALGMVFQSYAIWPHMTVFENAAFPLRVGKPKPSKAEVQRRVDEMLELVQLTGYADRPATQLSGGQQQRLAFARALIRHPRLLLLDEPLSNLDARLRDRMRDELRVLQRRLGITTLYVTHDQVEALTLSDQIAVMDGGHIVQLGTPQQIYQRPTTRFVAGFVGSASFLPGVIVGPAADGRMCVKVGDGVVEVTCPPGASVDQHVTLSVRPESVVVHVEGRDAPNVVAGTVRSVLYVGDAVDCRLDLGGPVLLARLHPRTRLAAGDSVNVELAVEDITVISDEHGIASGSVLEDEAVDSGAVAMA